MQNESGVKTAGWRLGQAQRSPSPHSSDNALKSYVTFSARMHFIHILFQQDLTSGWGSPESMAERRQAAHLPGKGDSPCQNLSRYLWGKHWPKRLTRTILTGYPLKCKIKIIIIHITMVLFFLRLDLLNSVQIPLLDKTS